VGELGLGDGVACLTGVLDFLLSVRNLAGGVNEMGFGGIFGSPEIFKVIKAAKQGEAALA
jgi:hypothetical protein